MGIKGVSAIIFSTGGGVSLTFTKPGPDSSATTQESDNY